MKKILSYLLIVLFVTTTQTLFSQVIGISASKLGTYCVTPVPVNTIEFEPAFSTAFSKGYWDDMGKFNSYNSAYDSLSFSNEMAFRFSYGLTKNIEMGMFIPVNGEMLAAGIKYQILEGHFALLGGMQIPLTSYANTSSANKDFASAAGGIVLSFNTNDKSSLDFNLQGQKYLENTGDRHSADFFVSSDFGYYVVDGIQLVLGLGYTSSIYEQKINNSNLFTINPGITLEKAENFILVLNYPIDIFGKNIEKSNAFGLALTIILD